MEPEYFNYLYDSSESDDDFDNIGDAITRNEDYLEQTVAQYSEEIFLNHFRVSRNLATQISKKFESSDFYKHQSGQFGKISSYNQVLVFLWYMGHQTASFADVTDRFNITKSSLERILRRLSVFLSNLAAQVITWPSDEEKVEIEKQFREIGFSNIVGAIGGSHIKIDKPEHDPDSYINRKGYYSIQIQAVCDNKCKIRDVFLGYPGSVHDSQVFRNSPLFCTLSEKCKQFFILGDSGYPLRANLLTPFKDRGQLNAKQTNYNFQLVKNRQVIEHCFALLKQKFRRLYHIKLRRLDYIVHMIRAACVLHNLALEDELFIEENEEHGNLDDNQLENIGNEEELDGDGDARRIRDVVVHSLP